ncbi:hypothetical protein FJZ53_05460 [Candidatus Woesearchaeota archaeon]|nr:hypothetical protein [Candidatus Woesearchaeota archaeon]
MVTIRIPGWIFKLKDADLRPSVLYEKTMRLLRDTSIEVYICAALGLATGLTASYIHESNREKTIPLAFSEVKTTDSISPVTKYLAGANDVPMKVFECWNKSYQNIGEDSVKAFASELESMIGSTYSSSEFNELLSGMPKRSEEALAEMKSIVNVMNKVAVVDSNLDAAWDDRHHDHYRTETYLDTETHTGADGKSYTTTVVKTREVYDHTHHYYDYNKDAGEAASRSLDELVSSEQSLIITPVTRIVEVSAEGKEVIRKSRKNGHSLSDEQILEIANTWNTGSTINANLPLVYSMWSLLRIDADKWRVAKNTAESVSYQTGSSRDSGPEEFQVAETALSHGQELFYSAKDMMRGFEFVNQNSPVMKDLIHQYVAVALYEQPGDAKRLRREIMSMLREWYNLNFKNGIDVQPFRAYMIFLLSLAGLAGGVGLGVGVDYLGSKYRLWGKREQSTYG